MLKIQTGIFLFLLLVLQLFLHVTGASQDSFALKTEIDKIIRFDTEINFKEVPGFVIGVIDGDSVYYFSYGKKYDTKKSLPPEKTDIFETGSISKLYTARIINLLEAEKKINSEDYVNQLIPENFINPRLNHLKISDLINHRSGLPLRPHLFGIKETAIQNPYSNYTKEDVLTFYRDYIPQKEGFVYSHTNYALLEIIIENVTGLDFDDVFKHYITEPLGVSSTFIDFPEQKENLICPGYDRKSDLVKPWTFSSFRASEGVKTSVEDAVTFLKSVQKNYLNQKDVNDRAEMVQNDVIPGLNEHLFIENGWHILTARGKKIGIHTGRSSGHSCFMGMVKETNTAVVVFSNSWIGTGDLGLQILRMINQNWKF